MNTWNFTFWPVALLYMFGVFLGAGIGMLVAGAKFGWGPAAYLVSAVTGAASMFLRCRKPAASPPSAPRF